MAYNYIPWEGQGNGSPTFVVYFENLAYYTPKRKGIIRLQAEDEILKFAIKDVV